MFSKLPVGSGPCDETRCRAPACSVGVKAVSGRSLPAVHTVTEFQGPAGLSQLILTKYRDDFLRTATEKLLTYALGRGVEYYDYPTIRSINRLAARDNHRISSWILAIVKSTPFQMRRPSDS